MDGSCVNYKYFACAGHHLQSPLRSDVSGHCQGTVESLRSEESQNGLGERPDSVKQDSRSNQGSSMRNAQCVPRWDSRDMDISARCCRRRHDSVGAESHFGWSYHAELPIRADSGAFPFQGQAERDSPLERISEFLQDHLRAQQPFQPSSDQISSAFMVQQQHELLGFQAQQQDGYSQGIRVE